MEKITFDAIKKEDISLTELAANKITQFIVDNKLKDGDKLPTETELCNYLGVGRGTVREAVKLLISRNILIIKRGSGTFVAKNPGVVDDPWGFTFIQDKRKLAKELWEMRLIVEPGVAALAAERATDEVIEELRKLAKEIPKLIAENKSHEELEKKFHGLIAQSTDNHVLQQIVPLIDYGISIFVKITESNLIEETISTQQEIVDAIASHDKERAYNAMKKHIIMNIDYIDNEIKTKS